MKTEQPEIAPDFTGILPGVPAHIYHAQPQISAHGLHKIAKAPELFIYGLTAPRKRTPAMRWGTLVHLIALEPENFAKEVTVLPADAPDRPAARSVNAKRPRPEVMEAAAWWAAFDAENIGKEVVTREEMDKLNATLGALMSHPSAGRILLAGGLSEASMFWRDAETGIGCRARPDRIHANGNIIVDIKTTNDASAESFSSDVWNFRYDVQAAFYLDGYRAISGADAMFVFVCIETEPPYLGACYVATPEMIEVGRSRYRRDLATYAACVESGKWPGYGDAVMPLDLPAWAVKKQNQ